MSELKTFPSNRIDALTMLYLEKRFDFAEGTPEQLAALYTSVRKEITKALSSNNKGKAQLIGY